MKSPESPYFSPPALPASDHPLSMKGRFGRLSFIAWSAFLYFIFLFGSIALGLSIDIVNISTHSLDPNWLISLQGLASIGVLVMVLAYVYFALVVTVRRLHDMNRSGWLILLFLLPVVNILLGLYLLLGSGTAGINNYGLPRETPVWEKILAWLMIIITVLSFLASGSMVSYMFGTGELEMPQEVIQKGTQYF